jgi:uncharacterized membrane protein YeaQ/YmgE (transglycosylase-associated protein family)
MRGRRKGKGVLMTITQLIAWIVVGGLAGYAANEIVGGVKRLGIVSAVIIGVIGGFIGGWVLSLLHAYVGGGLIGEVITSFIGAVILLLVLRYIRRF